MNIFPIEGKAITAFYRSNGIRARVDWRKSVEVKTGYFRFALEMDPRERFSRIESSHRELANVVANLRRKHGMSGDIQLIPTTVPFPSIETPHPSPMVLQASNRILLEGKPHTGAIGRSYLSEVREEQVDLADTPHYLIAGITNAGKSVLLRNLLLSLAARTPSSELKFLLIDLKNEDLVPLAKLPHVLGFAGTTEAALEMLQWLDEEKRLRIEDASRKPFRIITVVDEMAHLAGIKEATEILAKLATIGRSKYLNLIGATQHPTREGGMATLLKANFGERLIGQVAPGQSQYATNLPGTHAEALPGKGAFLRCSGSKVYRFQSYYTTLEQTTDLVSVIRRNDSAGGYSTGYSTGYLPVTGSQNNQLQAGYLPVITDTPTSAPPATAVTVTSAPLSFPISPARPLTAEEAKHLQKISREGELDYRGSFSLSAACRYVFGNKNGQLLEYVKEALG